MKNKEITDPIIHNIIIREKIYMIRGKKVMFDSDLAVLYGVGTKRLNEAVKRNIKRFPFDFMFKLNNEESSLFLRSQFATSNWSENNDEDSRSQFATLNQDDLNLKSQIATSSWGGGRKGTYVFTEQGIAMLSSVLKSDRAIEVNIQIMRMFTRLREMMDTYKELREKVEEMEKSNKANFKEIFEVIKIIIKEKVEPRNQIGFTTG
jgi:uncharacterized protein (UPF0147 family)